MKRLAWLRFEILSTQGWQGSAQLPHGLKTALEPFVTAVEGAALLHINPKTLTRFAREDRIPAHAFGSAKRRQWLFLLSETARVGAL
jgi:hypothetical protein